ILKRMKPAIFGHAFNRRHLAAFRIQTEHLAGKTRTPVDQHCASAAFAKFTAMLRSGEIQIFTQDFKQSLVRRERNFRRFTIQNEPNVRLLSGHLWFLLRALRLCERQIHAKAQRREGSRRVTLSRPRPPASSSYPTPHYRSAGSCR